MKRNDESPTTLSAQPPPALWIPIVVNARGQRVVASPPRPSPAAAHQRNPLPVPVHDRRAA